MHISSSLHYLYFISYIMSASHQLDWNLNCLIHKCIKGYDNKHIFYGVLQFSSIDDHGTRIIIYNLWEDDHGLLELDFDSDPHVGLS